MGVWFLAGGIAAAVAALAAMCGSTPGIANSVGTGVVPGTSVSSPAPAATRAAAPAARLNTGKLAAFVYKVSPEPVAEFPFFDAEKQTQTIASHKGKVVLLNLWATWCVPCREEMPALDRLQKELGSDKFEVVAVSVDKNGFDAARKFLDGIVVKSLRYYSDPTGRAPLHVKAIGMPATLLVDAEGREIGRLIGPAEWDSPDAKRLIEAALE